MSNVLARTYAYSRTTGTRLAFTLIEVVIALALISVIAALGLFASMDTYRETTLESERDTLVSLLTRARSRALLGTDAKAQSVCLDSDTYVTFEPPYGTGREWEHVPSGKSVAVSGIPSCADGGIMFSPLSAETESRTLTLSRDSRTITIELSKAGGIFAH